MEKKAIINDFGNGFGVLRSSGEFVLISYLDCEEIATPEPSWPWCSEEGEDEKEYRLATRLDDTTGELLSALSKIYSKKWGIPFRDAYYLLGLAWAQGWRLREIIKINPLQLERIHSHLLQPMLEEMVEEKIISGDLAPEEGQDLLELLREGWLPEELVIEFLAYTRARNFTGEVRLGPPQEEEKKSTTQPIPEWVWVELKNIITLRSGREAYSRSERIKSIIPGLPKEEARRVKRFLKEAWEARKKFASLSPEERLKKTREEYGWLF